jgi:uncharacterized protein YndB with AHSA1/START domain
MKTILHSFVVNASPDKVYKALTTADGLSNWWSREVKYDGKEGSVIQFTFLRGFNPAMRVEKLENERLVKMGMYRWA